MLHTAYTLRPLRWRVARRARRAQWAVTGRGFSVLHAGHQPSPSWISVRPNGFVQFQRQFEYLFRAAMVSRSLRPIVIALVAPALSLLSASRSGAQAGDARAATDTRAAASADR